jgi:hypothetical protein
MIKLSELKTDKYSARFLLICFVCFLMLSSTILETLPTASAVVYSPGVSVGQYAKYSVTQIPAAPDSLSWSRLEVAGISGSNVTLQASGQFENGTMAQTNTVRYDFVANSLANIAGPGIIVKTSFSQNQVVYKLVRLNSAWLPISGILVGASLSETDPLFWGSTTVENRTYLGVSRTVNVCRYTFSYSSDNATVVYDKVTGMMLEMAVKVPDLITATIIETNLFGSTPSPTPVVTPSPTPVVTPTHSSTPTSTHIATSTPASSSLSPITSSPDPSPSVPELTPIVLIATLAVISIAVLVFVRKKRT